VNRPVFLEHGLEAPESLECGPISRVLIGFHNRRPLATRNFHGSDLIGKGARLTSALAAQLALDCVGILLVSTDGILFSEILRRRTHQLVCHRTVEAISVHSIDHLPLTEAIALSSAEDVEGQL